MPFQVQTGKKRILKKQKCACFCTLKGKRPTTELPSGEENFDDIHPHLSEMLRFLGK